MASFVAETKRGAFKTWGRETAIVMFLFIAALAWRGDRTEEVKILVYPISVFGMLAYGYKNVEYISMAVGGREKEKNDPLA